MYTIKYLDLRGYRDEPIAHTFYEQKEGSSHAAFLLPGIGYTSHMPLLYYPARIMLGLGADVLGLEYDYNRREEYMNLGGEERKRWLISDVSKACHGVLGERSYEQITLIGKSLGTRAMGYLLTEDPHFQQARAIWLTPVLRSEALRKQILRTTQRSLFVIGTADPNYDKAQLEEIQGATGGESLVVEGADHSLEIEGNVQRSLKVMGSVVSAIQAFVTS